ncbi:MAG: AMP-binding protein, partial [Bacteroidia bacterium]|nr:AMP-binding protein [Bacteroidia bacterium]
MEHYLTKLERTFKNYWTNVALANYKGESFTFEDVAVNIEKFHIFFEAIGLKKGDKVALCAKNTARWAVSFLAINTFETVVVPILADFTPDSINHLVDHSESLVLFTDTDMFKKLRISEMPRVRAVVSVSDFTLLYSSENSIQEAFDNLKNSFNIRFPMGFSRENVSFPVDNLNDICVINYTSGTTSAP